MTIGIAVLTLIGVGGMLTNLLSTRSMTLSGRSAERSIGLQCTFRNDLLFPLRTAAIVEIVEPAAPGIKRWCELPGIQRDQAVAEVVGTVGAAEVSISFRSRQIMSIAY